MPRRRWLKGARVGTKCLGAGRVKDTQSSRLRLTGGKVGYSVSDVVDGAFPVIAGSGVDSKHSTGGRGRYVGGIGYPSYR